MAAEIFAAMPDWDGSRTGDAAGNAVGSVATGKLQLARIFLNRQTHLGGRHWKPPQHVQCVYGMLAHQPL